MIIDLVLIGQKLSGIMNRYAITAPTVTDWATNLYDRIADDKDSVRLVEIMTVDTLDRSGMTADTATRLVINLMNRLLERND